jgi:hypothetical protein
MQVVQPYDADAKRLHWLSPRGRNNCVKMR